MRLIDLSRELYHRTPTHPSHPPVVRTDWNTHDEIKQDAEVTFTSRSMVISMGDHAGTHVDAPAHFAPALAYALDRLATFVKNPGGLPELLFGKA